MPPEDAALDAGLDTDLGTETAEVEESSTPETITEGTEQTAQGEADAGTAQGEPPTAKALYQKAMSLDPELAKGLRKPLFEAEAWRKEVPGGIAEVRQLRDTVERLGGEEGIKGLTAEVEGWQNFDEKYMAGDPEVIEFMLKGFPDDPASAEAAQTAFLKLAPSIFGKYAELDSEGFTAYVMQQVQADAYQAGIPLALMRLEDFLMGDDATSKAAKALFDQVKGYFTRVDAWAKRPVGTKTAKAADPTQTSALDKRQKDLDDREAKATRNEWNDEVFRQVDPIYKAEFAKLLGNRKISDNQSKAIHKLFDVEYKEARKADLQKAQAYFKGKDREGFVKYTVNSAKTLIPRVMRGVFESLLPGKPGPQPGARQVQAPVPYRARAVPLSPETPRSHSSSSFRMSTVPT